MIGKGGNSRNGNRFPPFFGTTDIALGPGFCVRSRQDDSCDSTIVRGIHERHPGSGYVESVMRLRHGYGVRPGFSATDCRWVF
jgi:hypothetical protein